MAEGQLVRHEVMPITGVRGWGDRMEAHMDHAWLMMRSHAHGETRVHSWELGVVEVGGGGNDDNRGDDDDRSRSSAGSRGSKGKGVGRPRKAQRTGPPTPLPTVPTVTPSAQVADWLQQQHAQPQWQQRVVTAEGEVPQLWGKQQDAQHEAQRARDWAQAAEKERHQLRARVKELEARIPKGPVQQQ